MLILFDRRLIIEQKSARIFIEKVTVLRRTRFPCRKALCNSILQLFLSCEYVQRGRREGEEDQGGGGRRSRPDGRVAEVRGAGADAGLAVGAVVGLRGEAAALVDRHAAF